MRHAFVDFESHFNALLRHALRDENAAVRKTFLPYAKPDLRRTTPPHFRSN
jgi:hypothetical protein